jgi:hypothetical protein
VIRVASIAVAVAGALLAAGAAKAAPMGFKDSFMTMVDLSPGWREGMVNYAVTPRDAFGLAVLRVRSDDETLTRDAVELTYTRLVQRWNLPDAQANIWFIGAAGSVKGKELGRASTLLAPALQLDYETTRIYGSVLGRLFRADGINHDTATARAGFSLYEADYDEVQPWIVLEVRRSRGLTDKNEITPMLRLIHKRYFLELGVSDSSQFRASLMVTY